MKPKAEGKENQSEPVKEVKEVTEMLGVNWSGHGEVTQRLGIPSAKLT